MSTPSMPPAPTHPLALKVLRASRPTVQPSSGSPSLSLPAPLVLPAAFGAIYLGEHFSGLLALSILATHNEPVLRPVLRVDLLPPSRTNKIPLGAVDAPVLHPRKSHIDHQSKDPSSTPHTLWTEADGLELAVSHEMTELGLHTLSCTVSYDELLVPSSPPPIVLSSPTTTQNELISISEHGPGQVTEDDSDLFARTTRTFRKLYKFQVLNPLSVKTKFFSPIHLNTSNSTSSCKTTPQDATLTNVQLSFAGSNSSGQGFLEVQIQNQTGTGLIFDKLSLDGTIPSSTTTATTTATTTTTTSSSSKAEEARSWRTISRGDAAQTLFKVSEGESIGRLSICWTSRLGEPGHLNTSPLSGIPAYSPPPQLIVHSRPARVILGRPFSVVFSIPRKGAGSRYHFKVVPIESSLSVPLGQSPLLPMVMDEDGGDGGEQDRVWFKVSRVAIETGLIEVAGVQGFMKSGSSKDWTDGDNDEEEEKRWESLGYVWCEKGD